MNNWSKMKNKYILSIVTLFILVSCGSSEKLGDKIIGEWTMEKVYEYGADVTARHNPEHNRWIKFNEDGTFVSGGDPFGRNTGKWKLDNKKSILSIDSDVDDDDSTWNVTINDDEMSWTGIGHPRKENTKIIHRRK